MSALLPPFLGKGLQHSSSKAILLVPFSLKGLGKRMLSFFAHDLSLSQLNLGRDPVPSLCPSLSLCNTPSLLIEVHLEAFSERDGFRIPKTAVPWRLQGPELLQSNNYSHISPESSNFQVVPIEAVPAVTVLSIRKASTASDPPQGGHFRRPCCVQPRPHSGLCGGVAAQL